MKNKKYPVIPFVQPVLPDVQDLCGEIQEIWDSKLVTNSGPKHVLFENKLCSTLKSPNVSLINNGTTALMIALKACNLPHGSEVITTPFTFPATPHSIVWNGLNPVFCDIKEDTLCIDPSKIESLITKKTSAILGVHVYGHPCDVLAIEKIARKHNLKVIYDAAHAFLTEINGVGIGSFGDITMFSFHATKIFNSIEGGCLTYNDSSFVEKIFRIRDFGIKGYEPIKDVGLNGKLNEIQSAVGLLNLKTLNIEREKRASVKKIYNTKLLSCEGIKIFKMPKNVQDSFQYYPILVTEKYIISRDELYSRFEKADIITKKYFYPLCSQYECYKHLESSSKNNLPVANKIQDQILCLPIHGNLSQRDLQRICNIILNR